MAKFFRPGTGEASLLSKIDSGREFHRRRAISNISGREEILANAVATKLVDAELVETTNKNVLQEMLEKCLAVIGRADDFDIDYKTSPFRDLVPNHNVVTLYLTAFVLEDLIDHKAVVDIYGTDEDVYHCIDGPVVKHLA